MSYGEITAGIKGRREQMRWQATLTYAEGVLYGDALASAFNGSKFPDIQQVFPYLFDDIKMPEGKPAWQIYKERILAHRDDYKRNRGDKH